MKPWVDYEKLEIQELRNIRKFLFVVLLSRFMFFSHGYFFELRKEL